eukprot:scaffold3055_cov402-Prasinococcus_capsulatus_cf.AAC.1
MGPGVDTSDFDSPAGPAGHGVSAGESFTGRVWPGVRRAAREGEIPALGGLSFGAGGSISDPFGDFDEDIPLPYLGGHPAGGPLERHMPDTWTALEQDRLCKAVCSFICWARPHSGSQYASFFVTRTPPGLLYRLLQLHVAHAESFRLAVEVLGSYLVFEPGQLAVRLQTIDTGFNALPTSGIGGLGAASHLAAEWCSVKAAERRQSGSAFWALGGLASYIAASCITAASESKGRVRSAKAVLSPMLAGRV